MPEGHTLHRLARQQQRTFGGTVVSASSPQGRFEAGAAAIDGHELVRAEAYGKHLLHHYRDPDGRTGPILHVHLGLYGKFVEGTGEPPEPRGALRLRLANGERYADLRGPTACELVTPEGVDELRARLGPDPLRPKDDPARAFARIHRSRAPIGVLLMDQSVIAGIGNVYRAEILFRHRLDPLRPGRDVPERLWDELWPDLVTLMKAGVRSGRIVTVRDEDRPAGPRSRLTRAQANYVYRRSGLPCRVCGTVIRTELMATRNLFFCPSCQAPTG